MRRAQKEIGLYADEVFGGELTMDEAMDITHINISKFIEAAQRRDEGRQDGRTASMLLHALAIGLGDDTIATIIRKARESVPTSKWLLSHKDALEEARAKYDEQATNTVHIDFERFRQMGRSRLRRPLKTLRTES
jgi:hypothetical protein